MTCWTSPILLEQWQRTLRKDGVLEISDDKRPVLISTNPYHILNFWSQEAWNGFGTLPKIQIGLGRWFLSEALQHGIRWVHLREKWYHVTSWSSEGRFNQILKETSLPRGNAGGDHLIIRPVTTTNYLYRAYRWLEGQLWSTKEKTQAIKSIFFSLSLFPSHLSPYATPMEKAHGWCVKIYHTPSKFLATGMSHLFKEKGRDTIWIRSLEQSL